MTDFTHYTASELAAYLNLEITHLGVRAGDMRDDERMTETREAIDALKALALATKYSTLGGLRKSCREEAEGYRR